MFFDSHAHISCDPLADNAQELIQRAHEQKVLGIVNICVDEKSLYKGLELAGSFEQFYNVASTTPHDVEKEGESFFPLVQKAAKEGKLVAIGETGLDYYYEHSPKELQKKYLKKYFSLAIENQLPVVIHCRDAFDDFFDVMDSDYCENGKYFPGVLHCFTGTLDEAKEVIKRGWFLSLSGIVTFKKSDILKEVGAFVPLEQLLIETDSPYLAPQSKRGKQNEPANVVEIAQCIAGLKGIKVEDVARQTSLNTKSLFGLK
jgi:TatD DNase family protein